MYTHTSIHIFEWIKTQIYIYIYICICICIYIYIYVYVYVCVYMYLRASARSTASRELVNSAVTSLTCRSSDCRTHCRYARVSNACQKSVKRVSKECQKSVKRVSKEFYRRPVFSERGLLAFAYLYFRRVAQRCVELVVQWPFSLLAALCVCACVGV